MTTAAIIVLVVDDEPAIVDIIEEALTEAGFDVRTANSGESALAALEEAGGHIRAVVTDINLGSDSNAMTGWDVARRARELSPSTAVVYMSGAQADQWPSEGVPNSLLVKKPFATAQIVTAISQLLNAASSQLPSPDAG